MIFSCASAKQNIKDFDYHAMKGYHFCEKENWTSAKAHFAAALDLAEASEAEPSKRLRLHLEYAKALGATCSYDDAKHHLEEADWIIRLNNLGWRLVPQIELARLYYAMGEYRNAAIEYGMIINLGFKLMKKHHATEDIEEMADIFTDAIIELHKMQKTLGKESPLSDLPGELTELIETAGNYNDNISTSVYGRFCE
jgi:tetratricopeptide (TPR) repeat protein